MKNQTHVKFLIFALCLWVLFCVTPFASTVNASVQAGISNLDRLYLRATSTGPILNVRQNGTGDIVRFQDGGSTVLSIGDGGMFTIDSGAMVFGQQSETVTATFILTPTAPFILITSDSAYTSSTDTPVITTTATANQMLMIQNGNASDALTVDGTGGTIECKADVVLGAGDIMTLIYSESDLVWHCQSVYDNS